MGLYQKAIMLLEGQLSECGGLTPLWHKSLKRKALSSQRTPACESRSAPLRGHATERFAQELPFGYNYHLLIQSQGKASGNLV